MKISKELIKGSTVLLVSNLLKEKPLYGYEMIKAMEIKSQGLFQWKEGTLYPILHGLESEGYLSSYWETPSAGRKRKYYEITKKGTKELSRREKEWKTFSDTVNLSLGGIQWMGN